MKTLKAKDNIFKINNHTIKVSCISKPLRSANEKSVYKKICTIILIHSKDSKTELVTINMRSAIQLIMNNFDFNTMSIDLFGTKTNIADVVIKRNLRNYIIEEVDNKSVYE